MKRGMRGVGGAVSRSFSGGGGLASRTYLGRGRSQYRSKFSGNSSFVSDFAQEIVENSANEILYDGEAHTPVPKKPGGMLAAIVIEMSRGGKSPSASPAHTEHQEIDLARSSGFSAGAACGVDEGEAAQSQVVNRLIASGLGTESAGHLQRQRVRAGSPSFPGSPERRAAAQKGVEDAEKRLAEAQAEYLRIRSIADESYASISARTRNLT